MGTTAQHMSRGRLWSYLLWTVVCLTKMTLSGFPKRALMDPGKCESFCLSSGFQGSVGNCNCGYIMFSKRSDPGLMKHSYVDNADMANKDNSRDSFLAELTDEELLDALELLDKLKNNQHHDMELSDRELALFLWLMTSIESNMKE